MMYRGKWVLPRWKWLPNCEKHINSSEPQSRVLKIEEENTPSSHTLRFSPKEMNEKSENNKRANLSPTLHSKNSERQSNPIPDTLWRGYKTHRSSRSGWRWQNMVGINFNKPSQKHFGYQRGSCAECIWREVEVSVFGFNLIRGERKGRRKENDTPETNNNMQDQRILCLNARKIDLNSDSSYFTPWTPSFSSSSEISSVFDFSFVACPSSESRSAYILFLLSSTSFELCLSGSRKCPWPVSRRWNGRLDGAHLPQNSCSRHCVSTSVCLLCGRNQKSWF